MHDLASQGEVHEAAIVAERKTISLWGVRQRGHRERIWLVQRLFPSSTIGRRCFNLQEAGSRRSPPASGGPVGPLQANPRSSLIESPQISPQ